MNLSKELNNITKQIKVAQESSKKAITVCLSEMKKNLSDEDFLKWKDITSRMIEARLNGNEKMVEGLTNDLKNLLGGD